MGECVGPDHRLVGLDGCARQLRDQARRARDLCRVDAGLEAQPRPAHAQQHHDLFERRVACALADAIDRALDPPGARHDPGFRVGGGQAQVVVAVDREEYTIRPAGPADDLLDDLAELGGNAVAGRVGDVDHVGPQGDHRLDRLDHIVEVGTARVLGRVLHVLAKRPCVRDGFGALLEGLLPRQPELALDVQVGDRHDYVDLRRLRVSDGAPDGVDLVAVGPRERGHGHTPDLPRDAPARVELAGRRAREPGLDDVDPQLLELPGDAQLRGGVQVEARRLLAVAQRGVENEYAIRLGSLLAVFTFFRVHLDSSLETRKPPPRSGGFAICQLGFRSRAPPLAQSQGGRK